MANVRVRWIDSLSAAATGTKVIRNDVEIADIANGIQEYIDTAAPDDATPKYEVQAHDGAGDETTQEVEGVNMDYIDTAGAPSAPIITNLVVENAAPNNLVMTFDKAVTGTNLGFTVGGTTSGVFSSISGSGVTWTGVLADEVVFGETVTLSYDSITGDFEDTTDNVALASFSNSSVTNNVAEVVAPDAPTNLVAGTPTETTIPLTWTKSAGVMTEYRAYIGGALQQTFTGDVALGTLTGLTEDTLYSNITVRAFNGLESSDSNAVSATTEAGSGTGIPTANIIGYYEWEDNLVDDSGNGNDGTPVSITYRAGVVGQEAVFNSGNSSQVNLPAAPEFSFGNGTTDTLWSFSTILTLDTIRNSGILSKKTGANFEYEIILYGTDLYVTAYSQGTDANQIQRVYTFNPAATTPVHFVLTFGATGAGDSWDLYVEGVLQAPDSTTSDAGYVAMSVTAAPVTLGNTNDSSTYKLDGAMDGTAFWNIKLDQAQIDAIRASQMAGNRLLP